ncbi:MULTISPECIES: iron-containing alcohol dehydrogenase [Terrabacteria group]|uniref:iron-containing alcohol dehydrogenase n=1 Tax=Bacillati TaxID=1783272 RepID=UPI001C6DE399|nr:MULTISPECIES: iron-containing alcohol dehydrogenase [Terrabacteria group]MBW9211931.1 iron-containing alcohol dehydrogenase [Trueperella sp. zg.1013]
MENFVHDIPTKLYFGKGMISHLEESLKSFGKRVLLTYGGGSIKRVGLYDEVLEILTKAGFEVFECAGIEPNPRVESVARGADICKKEKIDVILSVGGGSVLDCSKAIAVGAYFNGDDYWQMVLASNGSQKALPLVAIMTMAATGSEFDSGGVISNMAIHKKIGRTFTFPAVSICDPCYTFTLPAKQSAAGGADMMSHIMEGYFSRTMNADLSEAIEEGILKSVIHNLPIVLQDPTNYEARANLFWNSSIACSGIPEYGKVSSGWPCHAMEHELSAFYDITHGVGLAILTPRWLSYILEKDSSITPRLVKFAKNVWGLENKDETELAKAGIQALYDFFVSVGIPMHLSELGIDETHFEEMAKSCTHPWFDGFVGLSEEDVVCIFKMCL